MLQKKSKNFRISVNGKLPIGVTSKDVILQIIGKIGTAGGTGYVIEYSGNLISSLSVEQRMTICNMTIEGGARAGLIQPDEKIIEYLNDKPMAPKKENWEKAVEYWSKLKTDTDAKFDKEITLEGHEIKPMVTWGTSPQDVVEIDGQVPNPDNEKDEDKKSSIKRSLNYMGLKPNTNIQDIKIDKVFIGSCTNGRIEDIRAAAKILKDKKIASHVNAIIVPDPKFKSTIIPKLINNIMYDGKRGVAAKIVYDAIDKIKTKSKKRNFNFDDSAIHAIISMSGFERSQVSDALERIMLYYEFAENKNINDEKIKEILFDTNQNQISELCKHICLGETRLSQQVSDRLFLQGVTPPQFISALILHFQKLHLVGLSITSGQSIGDAMKQIKPPIFFKEVNAFKTQIQNWNIAKVERALEILIESDLLTKTKPGLGKSIIGNIVIRLATVAKKQPN